VVQGGGAWRRWYVEISTTTSTHDIEKPQAQVAQHRQEVATGDPARGGLCEEDHGETRFRRNLPGSKETLKTMVDQLNGFSLGSNAASPRESWEKRRAGLGGQRGCRSRRPLETDLTGHREPARSKISRTQVPQTNSPRLTPPSHGGDFLSLRSRSDVEGAKCSEHQMVNINTMGSTSSNAFAAESPRVWHAKSVLLFTEGKLWRSGAGDSCRRYVGKDSRTR